MNKKTQLVIIILAPIFLAGCSIGVNKNAKSQQESINDNYPVYQINTKPVRVLAENETCKDEYVEHVRNDWGIRYLYPCWWEMPNSNSNLPPRFGPGQKEYYQELVDGTDFDIRRDTNMEIVKHKPEFTKAKDIIFKNKKAKLYLNRLFGSVKNSEQRIIFVKHNDAYITIRTNSVGTYFEEHRAIIDVIIDSIDFF